MKRSGDSHVRKGCIKTVQKRQAKAVQTETAKHRLHMHGTAKEYLTDIMASKRRYRDGRRRRDGEREKDRD